MLTKQDFDRMSVVAIILDTMVGSLYFWIRFDSANRAGIAEGDAGIVFVLGYGIQAILIGGLLGGLIRKSKASLFTPPVFYGVAMMLNYRIGTLNPLTIGLALFLLVAIVGIILVVHSVGMLITGIIAERTYQKPKEPKKPGKQVSSASTT